MFSKNRKLMINGLAIVSLFIAFYIGQVGNKKNDSFLNSELIAQYKIDQIKHEKNGMWAYANDSLIGFIEIGTSQGYGGPLDLIVLSDSNAKIINIELCDNSETLAYVNKLKKKGFFKQFIGFELNNTFELSDELDAVSGATISSRAIASACREASWEIAHSVFSIPKPELKKNWVFGYMEVISIIIFAMAFANLFLKNKKLKFITLFASLIVFGFLMNSSVSVSHFGRILLGYLPDLRSHFIWWLLVGGTILVIGIYGRNIYCQSLCPFHMVQSMLNKLSGINLAIHPKLNKLAMQTPKFLLWLSLVLILISKNSTLSSYEPFSMFFSLEGVGIQWYILPAALFGSLVVSSFFCRLFCPVGAGFRFLLDSRKSIIKNLKKPHEKV